jgi:hypothetical protein
MAGRVVTDAHPCNWKSTANNTNDTTGKTLMADTIDSLKTCIRQLIEIAYTIFLTKKRESRIAPGFS